VSLTKERPKSYIVANALIAGKVPAKVFLAVVHYGAGCSGIADADV